MSKLILFAFVRRHTLSYRFLCGSSTDYLFGGKTVSQRTAEICGGREVIEIQIRNPADHNHGALDCVHDGASSPPPRSGSNY